MTQNTHTQTSSTNFRSVSPFNRTTALLNVSVLQKMKEALLVFYLEGSALSSWALKLTVQDQVVSKYVFFTSKNTSKVKRNGIFYED